MKLKNTWISLKFNNILSLLTISQQMTLEKLIFQSCLKIILEIVFSK